MRKTKVTLQQDGNGVLCVYDADGKQITGISGINIDHDAVTGVTYISMVREVDLNDRMHAGE